MTTPCASARRSPTTRCLRSRRSCSSPPPSPGMVFGAEAVRGRLSGSSITSSAAKARARCRVFSRAPANDETGVLATVLGSIAFVVAATGAFLELQAALNTIWRVKPKPGAHLKAFLIDRLRSFGLVVAIGFLLDGLARGHGRSGCAERLAGPPLPEHPAGVERGQRARVARGDDGAVRPSLPLPARRAPALARCDDRRAS